MNIVLVVLVFVAISVGWVYIKVFLAFNKQKKETIREAAKKYRRIPGEDEG